MNVRFVVIGVVTVTSVVVAAQTTPKVASTVSNQAVSNEAQVSITSVTPQSVIAGTRFSVALKLSDTFSGPVTIVVRKKSPSSEQYRSVPLKDNDENDAAPAKGIIVHRVPTDAKWTSARSFNSPAAGTDRYVVSIDVPPIVQANRELTIVPTAAAVDVGMVRGWLANVEQGLRVYDTLRNSSTSASGKDWIVKNFSASDTVMAGSDGTIYVLTEPSDKAWNAAYLNRAGHRWALDLKGAGLAATNADTDAVLDALRKSQAQTLTDEVTSLGVVVASLPPDAQKAVFPQLDSIKKAISGIVY